MVKLRRAEDRGVLGCLAKRFSQCWDWVDRRQIDAHVVSFVVLWISIKITFWAMSYAQEGNRPGLEVAAIIAAIVGPWAALQGAVIKFVFATRQGSYFERHEQQADRGR